MSYALAVVLLLINSITSLLKNKRRIFELLLIIFMWVLFWGNYNNADYGNYLLRYEYIASTGQIFASSEIGFNLLMSFFSKLGLNYHQFLMIISMIGLILIYKAVVRHTSKLQLVFVLYFIHPFLLDIVQVRHFLAMSIIIFAISKLVENKRISSFLFSVLILIAFTIHYISIVFFPLLLIRKMKVSKVYVLVFTIIMIGVPLAYSDILMVIGSYIVPPQKLQVYFTNRPTIGFLVQYFIQILILIFIIYAKKIIDKKGIKDDYSDIVYKANILLIALFPLYIINGTFERAFRMIMIPNYIIYVKAFKLLRRREKVVMLFCLLIFVTVLFIFYVYIPSKNYVFYPIFNDNLFLK